MIAYNEEQKAKRVNRDNRVKLKKENDEERLRLDTMKGTITKMRKEVRCNCLLAPVARRQAAALHPGNDFQ